MPESKPRHQNDYLPPVIFFVVSLIFTLPFLLNWRYIGVGDWELFATMAAVPERTVLHYHQFPFWNPYIGGGNILFAHPEVGILSPFFLLILLFGAVGGIKIQMLISYFLGFWGTYLLSKKLGISQMASYLVAFVYFGSSYFALHFAIGHVPFTHFCFLPWFVYFLLKTRDNWKFVFASSLCIALIVIGNGAAVPFLYTIFFSGVFVLLYSIEKKNAKLIISYVVSIIVGLLLAAVKFIPMYHYLSQNKWEGMPYDATPLNFIFKAFFSFNQAIFQVVKTEEHWGWHEYSAYISPLAALLAIVGLIYAFRKCRLWLVIGVFFFIFGLGHFAGFSPWNLVLQIPGFSSIRSPARAFQFVVLAAAVMSGFGLDSLLKKVNVSDAAKRALAISLLGLVLLTNFLVNLPGLRTISHKLPEKVPFEEEFRHVIGSKYDIYNLFLKNRGSLVAPWLSAYKESRALVTPTNDVLMEYVAQGELQVIHRKYTPNRVEYTVSPASDGLILFGIGYDEGWSASDGRSLFENNGLVAASFRRGDSRIVLNYQTPRFTLGLIVSLLTVAGCFLLYFNRKLGERFKAILD
jgi:hypothetical protein